MTERPLPPSTQAALLNQPLPALYPSLSTSSQDTATSIPPLPTASSATVLSTIASAGDASTTPTASTSPSNDAPAAKTEPASEEEPYTLKCICGFTGDDGNTICCDICDSWQHIECFYPNNSEEATREEFAHACHECKPRALDVAHAVEFQRQRLHAATAEASAGHSKPKRPPSKSNNQSHKRKPKPSDLVDDTQRYPNGSAHELNGQHPHHPSHAPKRSKSSHKASQSLGGGASHTKRSPSYSASRASVQQGHPLSPATTPPDLPDGIEIHNYSTDFLSRCNNQDLVRNVQTNSFASLVVSNTTSVWLREPKRMLRETGHEYADVFQALPADMDSRRCSPRIDITRRILGQDMAVHWRYLSAPEPVAKDVPLMELNGQVGFQKDYCTVPSNRYEELSCPLPFVFFHPVLPLYIDTRTEGSLARYVRRSCRPNAVLDTFLSGGSEYHFWLVSDRHIDAGEQITIPWDFRLPHDAKGRMLRLLGLGDDDTTSHDDLDVGEDEYNRIARWVYLILSEYGGCACDLGNECAFARFHRAYGNRAHHTRTGSKKKSSRKPKPHVLSPTSTGHTTNSRAASEGRADEYPENDKLSASSRSKPSSRDMTPAPRQGSFDTLGILTEPTDRDKRKVAMVEDSFRRLEQHGPRPKKKRASDGAASGEKYTTTPSKPKAKTTSPGVRSQNHSDDHSELANGSTSHRYVDASSSSRGKSGSPVSAVLPGMSGGGHNHVFTSMANGFASSIAASGQHATGPSASYCDATIQTDPIEDEWFSTKSPPTRRRRKVVPLAKRLLNNRQRVRSGDFADAKQQTSQPSSSTAMDVDTAGPVISDGRLPDTAAAPGKQELTEESALDTLVDTPVDTPMPDAPVAPPAVSSPVPPSDEAIKPKSPSTTNASQPDAVPKEEAAEVNGEIKPVDPNSPVKKSPDLHVQLPKLPLLGEATSATAGNGATPLVASAITQSPFSITNANPFGSALATPSPIKKKLSLSDYKSRNTKSRKAAGQPAIGSTLKPPADSGDELKLAPTVNGTDGVESPTVAEQASEAPASAA